MCESSFRYRIQLNKHLKTLHALPAANLKAHPSTPVFSCTHCSFRHSSKAAYTHHVFNCKRVPKEELKYRCLICDRTFDTRDEVIRHRSTQEHRDASKSRRSVDGGGGGGGKLRTCQHCYQSFPNLPALKEHLLSNHVNLLPRCPNCLTMFALKQELSAHRFLSLIFYLFLFVCLFVILLCTCLCLQTGRMPSLDRFDSSSDFFFCSGRSSGRCADVLRCLLLRVPHKIRPLVSPSRRASDW